VDVFFEGGFEVLVFDEGRVAGLLTLCFGVAEVFAGLAD
jgi:hypothetical protein